MVNRPEKDEFAPYYLPYVNSVPEGDILSILKQQLEVTIHLVKNVSEEQGQFCYAPGKWSLKEVVGHMTDTEQIMAYRLLCIARGKPFLFLVLMKIGMLLMPHLISNQ